MADCQWGGRADEELLSGYGQFNPHNEGRIDLNFISFASVSHGVRRGEWSSNEA
jgi:hypothetical protein